MASTCESYRNVYCKPCFADCVVPFYGFLKVKVKIALYNAPPYAHQLSAVVRFY